MTLNEAIVAAQKLTVASIGCADRQYFVSQGHAHIGRLVAQKDANGFRNVGCTEREKAVIFGVAAK